MKKNLKIFALMLVALMAFSVGITKAYAEGEHEFSFRAFQCGTFDPDEGCLGPNGDGETPEFDYDNLVVNQGEVIKLGIYYKPGTQTFWNMSAFVFYNQNLTSAIHDEDDALLLEQTGTEYTTDNPGPYPPKGTSASNKTKTNWIVQFNDATQDHAIASIIKDTAGTEASRKYLEQEGILYYVYFKVKDDATPGATLAFNYDMSPGKTMIANKSPVTNQDIEFTIYEEQSDDNTLATLTVKNGSTVYPLTPEFVPGSKENKVFTAYVPDNITSVTIDATEHEEHATVSGTGTKSNLQYGNNSYDISVLSQSGQTEVYTVKVYRINGQNTLSALSLSNVDFGTFSSATTSYTATVPYTTDKTNVTATATAGNKATLTGTGNNKTLNVGSNAVSVTVSPESCKSQYSSVPGNTCTEKTYTVNVTRSEPSAISTLNDLLVDGDTVPGFTAGDPSSTYTLTDVGYDKSSIAITYVKGNDYETVTGDGTKNLTVGQNSFDVVVTAQDGTTKTTYTIKVYRKNNNANLSALNVTSSKTGSLSPAFTANTTSYTYNTDADETSVNISYTKADEHATVVTTPENLTGINPRTTSSVTIEVTPEDTTKTKKTYTITFAVAKSSNANLSDLTLDGATVTNFNKDTLSYDITYPQDKASVEIGATPEDDRVKSISNTGTKDLDYGLNTVKLLVTAEDNTTTKEYTLNITRTKKDNANLSDLKVDGTTVPGFSADKLVYDLDDVNYTKSSVNITYTKADGDAGVTGDGTRNLSVGDNELVVTVTAQNGTTTKEYKINIHRKSNDATLSALSVASDPAGTLSPAFSSGTTSYTYSVGADVTSVTVAGTANHSLASVTEAQTVNPRTTSSVTLTVTAEDTGYTEDYTVTFEMAKSSNANLSDLTIDGTTVYGFDPNETTYNITVPTTTEGVLVSAIAEDDRIKSISGLEYYSLDYGLNEIPVTVTAEDGTTTKTYTLNVTRTKKSDAEFLDLQVDDVTVPGFSASDPSGTTYDLGSVVSTKTSIKITVLKSDSDASVDGDGTKNLAIGDNTFPVTITAQNGTDSKTYNIKIKRMNNANNLETLTITSDPAGTLSPAFDPETTGYTYNVSADENEVTISATVPEGSGARVEGDGTYNPATTPVVTIKVFAEDNTEKDYVINLVRADSSNANLSDLTIDGTTIDGFDPEETEYNITVPSDKATLEIGAIAADDRIQSLTGDGEKDLSFGNNQFPITVIAQDGTQKVYYVNVTRALKNNANLSDLTADDVTVPGFDSDDPTGTVYDLGEVNSDKATIVIGAVLADTDARVTGDGTKTLETGVNEFPVTVTAQDNTTSKTYIVKVKKLSSDSSLTGIEIQADTTGNLDPEFDPTKTDYTYTSDPDEDEVTIVVTPAPGATAVIVGHPDGKVNPQDGEDVQVIVTAEDGSNTIYTIHVERGLSDNNYLDQLEVENFNIVPDFDKDEDHYTLTVDADVDKVTIIAHPEDDRASITNNSDVGEKDLSFGSNPFTITVKAENGSERPYYITIERELNDDVKLSDLKVNGETINGFDPETPSYDLGEVGNDVESLTITGTPQDDNATVEVEGADENGVVPLEVGENTIKVKVTAQDGTEGFYTITVDRAADDNNDLKALEVEDYTLDPAFDPDVTGYSITVPSNVDSVVVNATPDDDTATVVVEGNENLQPGENTITVTVKADDGSEKTYTITVTKEQEPEEDEKITSQIRLIEEGFIKDIVYKSLPEQLKDECDNENWKLHIFAEDEEVSEDQKLGTGMVIKLIKDDRVHDSDILVIKGEITGDGLIKVGDVVAVVNNYLDAENNPLEGAYFLAADMDDSGTIRVGDVVAIVNIYLGD